MNQSREKSNKELTSVNHCSSKITEKIKCHKAGDRKDFFTTAKPTLPAPSYKEKQTQRKPALLKRKHE